MTTVCATAVGALVELANSLVDSAQCLRLHLNESEGQIVFRLRFDRFVQFCGVVVVVGSDVADIANPALNLIQQFALTLQEQAANIAGPPADGHYRETDPCAQHFGTAFRVS